MGLVRRQRASVSLVAAGARKCGRSALCRNYDDSGEHKVTFLGLKFIERIRESYRHGSPLDLLCGNGKERLRFIFVRSQAHCLPSSAYGERFLSSSTKKIATNSAARHSRPSERPPAGREPSRSEDRSQLKSSSTILVPDSHDTWEDLSICCWRSLLRYAVRVQGWQGTRHSVSQNPAALVTEQVFMS